MTRKKKKKKEKAIQDKIKEQDEKAEQIKKETEEKLNQQKTEFENKQKEQEQQAKAELQAQKAKEKEDALIKQMKQHGNFPKLVVIGNAEYEFVITKPVVTFGRKAGNDYILNDDFVSGRHFKVFFIDNLYIIEDLGSSNGTIVNGKKIQQVRLNHGDIIKAGTIKMMFKQ